MSDKTINSKFFGTAAHLLKLTRQTCDLEDWARSAHLQENFTWEKK